MRAAGQPDFLQQLLGARTARRRRRRSPWARPRSRTPSATESGGRTGRRSRPSRHAVFASSSSPSLVMSTSSMSTEPDEGASRPAISPSSVDFPLPDGPTIGDELSVRNLNRQRMQDGERLTAAHDRFRHVAQFNHVLGRLLASAMGFRTAHTLSATIRAPAAVGWMPSRWFEVSSPATPCSRNGTSAT